MEDKYKKFNKSAKQLYQDLLNIYPDEKLIIFAQVAFKVFKKLDKKGPCNYFLSEVVDKYQTFINKKDDSFLVSNSALELPYFEKATDRLKTLWLSCRNEDKEAIWDHLNVMIYLACDSRDSN